MAGPGSNGLRRVTVGPEQPSFAYTIPMPARGVGSGYGAAFVAQAQEFLAAILGRRKVGARVPLDMSVAGYDNTPGAAFRAISLTTVEQFAAEIGAEAMRCVLARMKRRDRPARHVMVPPASSSAPRPRRRGARQPGRSRARR